MVVRDVYPEETGALEANPWINTAAIGLDPSKWEEDGLFSPGTQPRDLSLLRDEIGRLFVTKEVRQSAAAGT